MMNANVTRVYVPRFFVSSQQRFGATDVKAPGCHSSRSWTNCVIALRQISVTALFYLEDRRKIHLRGVRARQSKDTRRRAPQCVGCGEEGWGGREREPARGRALALASLFICLSLPGPVLCKLGQPGVLFVFPEVLTPVLRPSFVLFSGLFPSLSF